MVRPCAGCGGPIRSKNSRAKHCTRGCSVRATRLRQQGKTTVRIDLSPSEFSELSVTATTAGMDVTELLRRHTEQLFTKGMKA